MSAGAVVVTGASSGIGEATALHLARSGLRVFGGYRDPGDADRLMDAGLAPVRLDVTDAESVKEASAYVDRRLDGAGLAALVNNAGIVAAGPVETTPAETFRRVMEVNLFGVVRVTRAFLPLLRSARGRIVMVSSLSGRVAVPFLAPYAASKFALEGLSDSLRRELAPEGIDVVVVEPGPVRTPMWDIAGTVSAEDYRGGPYEHRVERARDAALETARRGHDLARVAAAIARVAVGPRPPARAVVATASDRFKFEIVRRLPDRAADALILGRASREEVEVSFAATSPAREYSGVRHPGRHRGTRSRE